MKTLENHVIIYDDQCPMCNLYTKAFVDAKMLDQEGRAPFSKLTPSLEHVIDLNRACNEIAMVNTKNGVVTYGIDSLFKVIGHRFAWLWPLLNFKPFRWLMAQFYAFISYNRKVIALGDGLEAAKSCTPALRIGYRWAYIVFAWLVTSLVLTAYAGSLDGLVPAGNFGREFLICGGQIGFQALVLGLLRQPRKIHYLGHLMTVSLIGSLLLLPLLAIGWVVNDLSLWIYFGWFALVVMFMLWEHARRVKHLQLHWGLSATWVVYRLLVLAIILWI